MDKNKNKEPYHKLLKAMFGDYPLVVIGIKNVFVDVKEKEVAIDWIDGTRTFSKVMDGDDFDILVGFSIAYAKHSFKSMSNYKKLILEGINITNFDNYVLDENGRIVLNNKNS